MPKLTQGNLHRIPILLPPLTEQRAIAGILGALDDKIAVNRRMGATLEAMARALFKSWFVDFDPIRAKAEGRDPALPPPLADLFPDAFDDDGAVPEGWRIGSVGEVAALGRDQVDPGVKPDALFAHFSLPAFDASRSPKIETGSAIRSQKFVVPGDAVLLSKLNPEIDRTWLADTDGIAEAVCSTEFLVLQARSGFSRAFLYCLLRSPVFRQGIESLVTGTSKSHQRAQPSSVLNLPAIIPGPAIVTAFTDTVAPLFDRQRVLMSEANSLAALRDTLLPKLISGDVRMPVAAIAAV